jgi:D-sedoheptulose 7-phosphate isomerase
MDLSDYIDKLKAIQYTNDLINRNAIHIANGVEAALGRGNRVFFCGNGGSAANASHITNDLQKGLGKPVLCLNDNVPVMTAWANDEDYSMIYKRQLEALAVTGDVLVVLSGSGNSPNVVIAAQTAQRKGLKVYGLLGRKGGAVAELCSCSLIVPSNDMQFIEDVHLMIGHWMFKHLMERKHNRLTGSPLGQ